MSLASPRSASVSPGARTATSARIQRSVLFPRLVSYEPPARDSFPHTPVELPDVNEIHLWRTNLDDCFANNQTDFHTISPSEQEHAGRFVFDDHRRRYVAARAWLRRVLGAYLNRSPLNVPLVANAHGKPCIAEEANSVGLQFNLSHSDRFGLLAVTVGQEIGVDLENLWRNTDWTAVAARFCTTEEKDYVETLAPEMRVVAFTEIWTRKEAAAKAIGEGLNSRIFSVTVGPAEWGEVGCGEGLVVRSLPDQEGFAAAVAVGPIRKFEARLVDSGFLRAKPLA